MAVLSRVNYGAIELLQVDSDPNGVTALTNSLAVLTTNNSVYKNVGGTTWVIFSAVSTAVTTANGQAAVIRYGANRLAIMVDEIEYY